jgi:hypothetical protein
VPQINPYKTRSLIYYNVRIEKISILPLVISATGIVPQSLFKNLKILDLDNTLVLEIQKGILLYSCSLTLTQNIIHNKVKMRRRDAGNYVDATELLLDSNIRKEKSLKI